MGAAVTDAVVKMVGLSERIAVDGSLARQLSRTFL